MDAGRGRERGGRAPSGRGTDPYAPAGAGRGRGRIDQSDDYYGPSSAARSGQSESRAGRSPEMRFSIGGERRFGSSGDGGGVSGLNRRHSSNERTSRQDYRGSGRGDRDGDRERRHDDGAGRSRGLGRGHSHVSGRACTSRDRGTPSRADRPRDVRISDRGVQYSKEKRGSGSGGGSPPSKRTRSR